MDNKTHEIVLTGGPGAGKCVLGETKVIINNNYLEIQDVWNNNYDYENEVFDGEGYWLVPKKKLHTQSVDKNGKIVKKQVTRIYRQKINEEGKRIALENGSILSMTNKHMLLNSNDQWVNNLKVGENVQVPNKLSNFKNVSLADDTLLVPIKSIDIIKINGWVYDLEVEDTHNYVAENIITHNTSSLSYLSEKLADMGYRVFIVPEVATLIAMGGVPDFARWINAKEENGDKTYYNLNKQIIKMQGVLREQFLELASHFPNEKKIILYDRAEMDALAYAGHEDFNAILQELNITKYDARDSYDAVIHLVTAAIGAEEHYTLENNPARRENTTEAKEADARTLKAWVGHPKIKIIDNSTSFEDKLHRVLSTITSIIGDPRPLEIEKKFLLSEVPSIDVLEELGAHKSVITQTYLRSSDNTEVRLRRRKADKSKTYYKTEKIEVKSNDNNLVREEREEIISKSAYDYLLNNKDDSKEVIIKHRYTFPFENNYYEVDIFKSPEHLLGMAIMEVELTEDEKNKDIKIPHGIIVDKEVTSNPSYKNINLARRIA